MRRVIVTNDDGINVAGIRELVKSLSHLADVYVFAPDTQNSGKSHAISIREKMTSKERKVEGAVYACEVGGTPADAVKYGLGFMDDRGIKVDYVISGINMGGNTGSDIVYSGTCGGAREGVLNGIRSIALSVNSHDATEFDYICSMLGDLMELSLELPATTFLNVNAPDKPMWKVKGVRIVPAAEHNFGKRFVIKPNEEGINSYVVDRVEYNHHVDNDYVKLNKNFATITPVATKLTDESALTTLNRMDFGGAMCVMIDLQEKLVPAMRKPERLEKNAEKLLRSLNRLDVPIVITEQYSKGLGRTLPSLTAAAGGKAAYIDKVEFDAFGQKDFEELMKKASGKHVILCGAESHICVLLTARSFIERGFEVHVAYDCCGSRTKGLHEGAMKQLAEMGAHVASWETIVYDMLGSSRHPAFRTISAIVKED